MRINNTIGRPDPHNDEQSKSQYKHSAGLPKPIAFPQHTYSSPFPPWGRPYPDRPPLSNFSFLALEPCAMVSILDTCGRPMQCQKVLAQGISGTPPRALVIWSRIYTLESGAGFEETQSRKINYLFQAVIVELCPALKKLHRSSFRPHEDA
jgi:hypothetical protein